MSEKWWDMSDDELDDFFREASDKVDIPFDSASYNKLRQKIAERPMSEPSRGFKKRWLLLLAGLFVMVGGGLVYRFGDDLKVNDSTEIVGNGENKNTINPSNIPLSMSSQTTSKSSVPPPLSVSSPTTGNKTVSENLAISSVQTQTLARLSVGTQTTAEKIAENKLTINDSITYGLSQNRVLESIFANSKRTKNNSIVFNNSKNLKDREGNNYPSNPEISEQSPSSIIQSLSNNLTENLPEETISKTNFYNVNFLKSKDSKSLSTDFHWELPPYVDSLPRTMKPVKFSRFGVRLVFSPDFNSIENMSKMALGGSVGLLFEYKISKKLVIQTGMVYSGKNYVGSFDDYNNWKDWKGYHSSKPTQVDGNCSVFDIPINVRLNLLQKPKQTWFVSSGVSSYWMMNEKYKYSYAWGSPREVGWNDNSKYYFSMMNFSVGFEKQISKRLNFQIEPYLKTPLKNLGRGGVNLYSSGVLFSTKYEF